MLNLLNNKQNQINEYLPPIKQSSLVILRKNKFKNRIEKQISKEKEKIKNLETAVPNILKGQNPSFFNRYKNSIHLENNKSSFISSISKNENNQQSSRKDLMIRRRRPQLYKCTHGFRLSFCNLTDKEKKDERASTYHKHIKNIRERDFFSRRQMYRENESLFDCLQKYYYENDDNIKKNDSGNKLKKSMYMGNEKNSNYAKKYYESMFSTYYKNHNRLSTRSGSCNIFLQNYLYDYFHLNYHRKKKRIGFIDDDDDEDDSDDEIEKRNANIINSISYNTNNSTKYMSTSKDEFEITKRDRRREEMVSRRRKQYKSRISKSLKNQDVDGIDPNLTQIICDECYKKIQNANNNYYVSIGHNVSTIKNKDDNECVNENKDITEKQYYCKYCRCIKEKELCNTFLTNNFSKLLLRSGRRYVRPTMKSEITSSKAERIKQYLKRTKISRKVQVWSKRKLFLMGLSNERQNLGNLLNITDRYNDDLSFDNDQSVKILESSMLHSIEIPGIENSFYIINVQSEQQLEKSPELSYLYNQANELVKTEFAAKDMYVHLESSLDEGLTIDIIVKEKSTRTKSYCQCYLKKDNLKANIDDESFFDGTNNESNYNTFSINNYNSSHSFLNEDEGFSANFQNSNGSNGSYNNYNNDSNYNHNKCYCDTYASSGSSSSCSNNNSNQSDYNSQSSHNTCFNDTQYAPSVISQQNIYSQSINQNSIYDQSDLINPWMDDRNEKLSNSSQSSQSSHVTLVNENNENFLDDYNDNSIRCCYCNKIRLCKKEEEEKSPSISSSSSWNYGSLETNSVENINTRNYTHTNTLSENKYNFNFKKNNNFSTRNVEVVAVIEYVFMKRYMWLEVIAVKQEYKGLGIGKTLMQRMSSIASAKDKDILLYSLNDVLSFYKQMDFEFSPKFPHKPYHDGWFMTKRCQAPKKIFFK